MHVDDDAHVTGIPHVFTALFALIILSMIATWIVPAGKLEKNPDLLHGIVFASQTYQEADSNPVGVMKALTTIYRGMVSAADTVFFVFITFSSISLMVSTGAFHAFIASLLCYFKGSTKILMIPLFITLIGMASSTIAVFEEMFPFIPLFVAIAIAMKYDALVGMSIVALGIGLGYSGAFLNPFTVGIAQNLAGLPPFSGAVFRIGCHLLMIAVASAYVMAYAIRISRKPEKSLMQGEKEAEVPIDGEVFAEHPLHARHGVILAIMLLGGVAIIWGVYRTNWSFEQLSSVYFCMALASGFVMGWSPNKIAHKWAESAAQITSTCLKIALAKGIVLILNNANVLDTIVYWTACPLMQLPKWGGAISMLAMQTIMNFFVPSGAGQAAVSMPIMIPVSDLLGISRQTAVLAYQFGDGLSNVLWLTGSMPIICKFAKVRPYKWLQWFIPLFCVLFLVQAFCISIALWIDY